MPVAIGDVNDHGNGATKSVVLLAPATATNGAPSGASAGLAVAEIYNLAGGKMPTEVSLLLYSTAGSGTMTVTARLWGYEPSLADWVPIGVGADATKGTINAGSAVGETGADKIRHLEPIDLVGIVGTRLYLEVVAIGGTSTSVTAEIVVRKGYAQ